MAITKTEKKLEFFHKKEFKHLMFEEENDEHIVSLIDVKGYKIARGYGTTIIAAINDLHHNFI